VHKFVFDREALLFGSSEEECMPTILRHGGYRFYFYSHEPNEPAHVHVDKGGFWLEPVSLARSVGFAAKDINAISRLVRDHREQLIEAWHGHFGGQDR
jgi:hypothetical protein